MWNELTSENPDIRKTAAAEILATRQADIGHILALAEKMIPQETRNGTVKSLMLLLGGLRATEAIPFLVRNLTFEVYYREAKRPQTLEDYCPAVQALVDIGSPSVNPALERAKAEDGEKIGKSVAGVLRGVFGRERAGEILGLEIAKAGDAAVKARLQGVATQLAALP